RWQPRRFTSEDQDNIGRLTEWRVPEQSLCPRGEEIRIAQSRKLVLECIPAWPHTRIDMFPVVKAGALHLRFIKREAKRFDQVQNSAGSETCPARVTGVPVNFRTDEYDVRCHGQS